MHREAGALTEAATSALSEAGTTTHVLVLLCNW